MKNVTGSRLTLPSTKTTGGVSPRGGAGENRERSTSKNGKFGFGVKK